MANRNKNTRGRKSMKGKWGIVGAPPKHIKFPKTKFSMARLFEMNSAVCELTIRERVKARIAAREIEKQPVRKQPKHGVGRPSDIFLVVKNSAPAKVRTPKKTVAVTAPAAVPETVAVNIAPAPTQNETVTASPALVESSAPAPVLIESIIPPLPQESIVSEQPVIA